MGDVTNCGICGSTRLNLILDLGLQPLAECMSADAPRYPLRLRKCAECDLVQLDYIAPPAEVFPEDHPYASGNAKALHEHFQKLANELSSALIPGDLVVDIGANDGTLLSKFPDRLERLGVEPTAQCLKHADHGVVPWMAFFTAATARQIVSRYGQAKVITATNVLAHVPDPHDFLEGVWILLADDGVFVTENHDVMYVLDGQWDTVYHEHIRYYSEDTLMRLLDMHGFEVTLIRQIPTHGGSFRMTTQKAQVVQHDAGKARDALRELLAGIRPDHRIVGIGATTRASAVIHFAGLQRQLAAVYEVSTSEKIGKVMPGTHIPIKDEAELFGPDQPPYAVLFSWHLSEQIVPKLREKGYRGQIIVPLPFPKVLTQESVHA